MLPRLLGEASHGTTLLPTDRLQSLEIAILPLAEQWAMAHIVGTLDDKAYA
jgi:restriction endonuclease S subunit